MTGIGFSTTSGVGGGVVAISFVVEQAARMLIDARSKYVFSVLIMNRFR